MTIRNGQRVSNVNEIIFSLFAIIYVVLAGRRLNPITDRIFGIEVCYGTRTDKYDILSFAFAHPQTAQKNT